MIGFRNVDMAELRIHTPAERVAIAEGHLFRVAFAIFFQLSQAAEFQDVPLFPGVFFFPATRSVYDAVLTWIFRVLILLSPLSGFSPHHLLSFGTRRNDVKRGLRNGVAPYIPAAFCRDAGSAGHGATEAARPERLLQARGFASGMEARQGGDSFAGSVHDSPPRQGDARKRHKQENNKTDNNQGSSNQSQNRRKKRIIKGKVM